MKKIASFGFYRFNRNADTGNLSEQIKEYQVTALAAGNKYSTFRTTDPGVLLEGCCSVGKEEAGKGTERKRSGNLDVTVTLWNGRIALRCREPEAEILVTAIVGMNGILTDDRKAIRGKKRILHLRIKETLVTAGLILLYRCSIKRKWAFSILPVDSEHSAIFQSLQGRDRRKHCIRSC